MLLVPTRIIDIHLANASQWVFHAQHCVAVKVANIQMGNESILVKGRENLIHGTISNKKFAAIKGELAQGVWSDFENIIFLNSLQYVECNHGLQC